jgi:hypothetical protein
MNSRTIKLLAAIVVLVTALLLLTRDQWFPPLNEWYTKEFKHVTEVAPPLTPPGLKAGQEFAVKRVQVLKGDQFDITLDGDARILGRLTVRAVDGIKHKVVDLLNNCENPRIRLVRKLEDGEWLVDFRVTQNGRDVDIATWLSDNKLVYKQ